LVVNIPPTEIMKSPKEIFEYVAGYGIVLSFIIFIMYRLLTTIFSVPFFVIISLYIIYYFVFCVSKAELSYKKTKKNEKIIKDSVKLHEKFYPSPLLPNCHLQVFVSYSN
jgi:uncharacterized membrane protein